MSFIKADVDDCPDLAEEYDVEVLPTFLLLEQRKRQHPESGEGLFEGRIKSSHIGQQVARISEELKDWLNKDTSNLELPEDLPQ